MGTIPAVLDSSPALAATADLSRLRPLWRSGLLLPPRGCLHHPLPGCRSPCRCLANGRSRTGGGAGSSRTPAVIPRCRWPGACASSPIMIGAVDGALSAIGGMIASTNPSAARRRRARRRALTKARTPAMPAAAVLMTTYLLRFPMG
jgi:hypothetical protein